MQDIHRFMGVYSSNELTPPLAYPTYVIAHFSRSYEKDCSTFCKQRYVYLFQCTQPFIHPQEYSKIYAP